jgi:hypothetical protein
MRRILQLISWLALVGTIGPSILVYYGKMDLSALKTTMLVATVVWFIATSLWMGREESSEPEEAASSAL